jgi:hypothetical protein
MDANDSATQPEIKFVPQPSVEPFRAPDAVGAPAERPNVEQLVEDWFRTHFQGLAGSLHESTYNHVHAAKEELKQLLRAIA